MVEDNGFKDAVESTTTNTGQPLSVGLFVFREPPRRAGLRAILPVPGETPTDPFSHEFAPALPSLLSKSWPTSPFWHRDILCCVSGLHLCRGDRFAITCASPVLRENRGPGASAQIRWAGRQWAENEAPGSAAVGRGPGRGASARPGHRPALPTPAREGPTSQISRTPAPEPGRCGARSRLTLVESVPGARAAGTARHPNGSEVPQSGPPTPAADARRGVVTLGRC